MKKNGLEVLVAAMNQKDLSLKDKLNITCDAIIANQADSEDYLSEQFGEQRVQMLTTKTRGVGKNRNLALDLSTADIVLFEDDDSPYNDGALDEVVRAFEKFPEADIIIFGRNIMKNGECYPENNEKTGRLPFLKSMKYGGASVAARRNKLIQKNIHFSELFGGGCIFSHGEDTDFIFQCYKKGLKVYYYSLILNTTRKDSSTWFTGFNEKYFYDTGAIYANLSKRIAKPMCIQMLLRHKSMYRESNLTFRKAYGIMKKGIKGYENLISYDEAKKRGII